MRCDPAAPGSVPEGSVLVKISMSSRFRFRLQVQLDFSAPHAPGINPRGSDSSGGSCTCSGTSRRCRTRWSRRHTPRAACCRGWRVWTCAEVVRSPPPSPPLPSAVGGLVCLFFYYRCLSSSTRRPSRLRSRSGRLRLRIYDHVLDFHDPASGPPSFGGPGCSCPSCLLRFRHRRARLRSPSSCVDSVHVPSSAPLPSAQSQLHGRHIHPRHGHRVPSSFPCAIAATSSLADDLSLFDTLVDPQLFRDRSDRLHRDLQAEHWRNALPRVGPPSLRLSDAMCMPRRLRHRPDPFAYALR